MKLGHLFTLIQFLVPLSLKAMYLVLPFPLFSDFLRFTSWGVGLLFHGPGFEFRFPNMLISSARVAFSGLPTLVIQLPEPGSCGRILSFGHDSTTAIIGTHEILMRLGL